MDKRAYSNFDDMIILFACFIIIGAGIVIGVWIFYSVGIDIRLDESKTMSNRLVGAIVENGYLNKEVLEDNFNILEKAGIDEKAIDSGNYYFNLIIFEEDSSVRSFVEGNKDFEIQCELPGAQMAKCYEKELIVSDGDKQYKIKVLTGSNQLGSRL